jgi:lysophospholipase L1-like esterase
MTVGEETDDPYCLRPGDAVRFLAAHPWRRFAVLGDSIAEGVFEPMPGYRPLAFADRVHQELRAVAPDLTYLNVGRRNLRTHEVRSGQLFAVCAFRPDLALLVCGANDALRPGYERRADAVDRDLAAMITTLHGYGAVVITVSIFVMPNYHGVVPAWLAPAFTERMTELAARTTSLARRLGTVHVDLARHPALADDDLTGPDGLHGNGRSQAIAAAETVRVLGAALAARSAPAAAR